MLIERLELLRYDNHKKVTFWVKLRSIKVNEVSSGCNRFIPVMSTLCLCMGSLSSAKRPVSTGCRWLATVPLCTVPWDNCPPLGTMWLREVWIEDFPEL